MEGPDVQTFLKLKSYCDSLIEQPNKVNALKVTEVVNNLSDSTVQYFREYCLLPILSSLRINTLSMDTKEELVRAMRVIIRKTRIKTLMEFNKIYETLLIQIFDRNQQSQVIKFHEELKEAVVLCITDVIHQSFLEVIESLYIKQNRLKLGQGILLCLTIARLDKSFTLKLAAINAVMALCQIDDKAHRLDIVLQNQIANSIMAFLPGIVSGLQEIAMAGEIQNHKITMMAVRAWGRIISLIMHDKEEEGDDVLSIEALMKKSHSAPTNKSVSRACNRKFEMKEQLKGEATRNKEWFELAALKLDHCIQLLDRIRSHSHYKVKRELVESINLIIQNCFRNMKPNIIALIDNLISLSEDESTEVSTRARDVLHTISENHVQNHDIKLLIDSLEERFYDLLTRLPARVRWSDDNEQLASLNQLAGYLRLLGKQRLPHIMRSQTHMQRLLLALVHIIVIDCNNVSLLQITNVKDLDDPAYFYGSDQWRQFKFIRTSSCKEKFVIICQMLREFGDVRTLVDTILEFISDLPQHRKELTLLLNWILVSIRDPSAVHLYKEIINFYTMEEIWYLPIEVTEETSLMQARSNVVQCCLLMEGLAQVAQNLQSDYDKYLLKTLYLIMERAGSSNCLISYVGVRTLEIVAATQQHKTIGDLLRANVDYFSYHVIMKLRQVERNPGVLNVIETVIKYSKLDFLPYLKGIVEDVLRQLSSPFQRKKSYCFLKVFYTFIMCVKTLVKTEELKIKKEETQVTSTPSETIILSVLEYNAKKMNERIEDDIEETKSDTNVSNDAPEETDDNFVGSTTEEDRDKKLPTYVKIIVEIMKNCLHFLPSKDVQNLLMAMQTLQAGLPLLIEWENEMLPLVHQLWHPLIDRFKDENVLVINRAWQLLHVLADISNDFIRHRTLQEVLPSISKFLIESSKKNIDNSESIYKYTQIYKLQYELLSTLGLIARLLQLHERDLWQILSDTQQYLSARQNPLLQACCMKLYKDIADYNGDITWAKCLSIWNSKVAQIASDATFDIKDVLNSNVAPSNEYCKNIREVIIYIEEKSA